MQSCSNLVSVSVILFLMSGCVIHTTPIETASKRPETLVEDDAFGMTYLAPGFNFRCYDYLVISEITPGKAVPLKDIEPEVMGSYLKSALVERISATGVFLSVSDDKSLLTTGKGPVLELAGSFSELDPGSRLLRYFVGLGARVELLFKSKPRSKILTRELCFEVWIA